MIVPVNSSPRSGKTETKKGPTENGGSMPVDGKTNEVPPRKRSGGSLRFNFRLHANVGGFDICLHDPVLDGDEETIPSANELLASPLDESSTPSVVSTASTQPDVIAFRELLKKHDKLVADYEGVTGRKISDELLWRWTSSRGGAESALQPFLAHAEWRCELGTIDEACIRGEIAAQKVFLQGCDVKGRPVVIILAARHSMKDRNLSETRKMICFTLETATTSANVQLNARGRLLCIFDLAGLGMGNLDSKALQSVFEVLQQHFPESLSELWFLNTPILFKGLWRLVSPFIQPATKDKIIFVGKAEQAARMSTLIPLKVLPVEYGGTRDMTSIESAARRVCVIEAEKALIKEEKAQESQIEGRFGFVKRAGTFMKVHNPIWAARVFGRTAKRSVMAIPRPNRFSWLRRRSEDGNSGTFSTRMSAVWKNRPPLRRPSYRLQNHAGQTTRLIYLDIVLLCFLLVLGTLSTIPAMQRAIREGFVFQNYARGLKTATNESMLAV